MTRDVSTEPKWTCLRCGHQWRSRTEARPVACAACCSAYWDKPRQAHRAHRAYTKPTKAQVAIAQPVRPDTGGLACPALPPPEFWRRSSKETKLNDECT